MSAPHQVRPASLLSPQLVNSVYIPSGLLLAGVGVLKVQWLPYAIAVAFVLGAWRIYSVGECSYHASTAAVRRFTDHVAQLQRRR